MIILKSFFIDRSIKKIKLIARFEKIREVLGLTIESLFDRFFCGDCEFVHKNVLKHIVAEIMEFKVAKIDGFKNN